MSIEFLCSKAECRTKLEVSDELAGKNVRCPKCRAVSIAPHRRAEGILRMTELPACPSSGGANAEPPSGFEMTLPDSNEQMGPPASSGQANAGGPKAGGVEELDEFLDGKRGRYQPFQIERELAHGGMGAVLLAKDRAIQRELAVKVMRPQIADSEEHRLRFLEEAQVTGQLEHPNIVPIHDLGKDAEGNLYFTMELVKGKSLGELLKELRSVGEREYGSMGDGKADGTADAHTPTRPHPQTPTLPDLLGVFLKVCDGMAFAHSRGVIHRDLKPDNIMVGEFGEVQIMDWGTGQGASHGPWDRRTIGPWDRRRGTGGRGRSQ